MIGLVMAAVAGLNFASTPQLAARQMTAFGNPSAVVVRTNVVGRYATVLLRGVVMESSPLTEPVLLKRFSFGWQTIDLVESRCIFTMRGISASTSGALMRGIPRLTDSSSCKGAYGNDYGPPREVDAVRRLSRGGLVPFVAVYGDWAKSAWFGAGGGEDYYRLHNGAWQYAFGGGGAYDFAYLLNRGIPKAALCPFRVYDVKCER